MIVSTVASVKRPGSVSWLASLNTSDAATTARPTSTCAPTHPRLAAPESSSTIAAHTAGRMTKTIVETLAGPYPVELLTRAPGRNPSTSSANGQTTAGATRIERPHRCTTHRATAPAPTQTGSRGDHDISTELRRFQLAAHHASDSA